MGSFRDMQPSKMRRRVLVIVVDSKRFNDPINDEIKVITDPEIDEDQYTNEDIEVYGTHSTQGATDIIKSIRESNERS